MNGKRLLMLALLLVVCLAGIATVSSDESSAAPDYNIYDNLSDKNVVGTYTFSSPKLTLTANNSGYDTQTIAIDFSEVGDVGDVTEIQVEGFREDVIAGFRTPFVNVTNIHYDGMIQEGNGTWVYDYINHTLQLSRVGAGTALPNPSTTSGGPFNDIKVVKNDSRLEVTVTGYRSGGAYLFFQFSMVSCSMPDYTEPESRLLYGATAKSLSFNSLTAITEGNPFSRDNAAQQNLKNTLEAVVLPSVITVGNNTFSDFTALSDVTMGSATTLGTNAFKGCTALVTVSLPALTNIGSSSFNGCTSLTTFECGNGATVGNNAFTGCISLTTISAERIRTIQYSAFKDCENLYESTGGRLVFTLLETTSSTTGTTESADYSPFKGCTSIVNIQLSAITTLAGYTFNGCTGLTTVAIGNSLETVSAYAFQNCTALNSVTFGTAVTTIGESAFNGCSSLTAVEFPDSLRTIGQSAFASTGLESVETNAVTTIGSTAFASCNALTSVDFGATLVSVGASAFYGSTNLAGDVDFGITVTSIGEQAFYATKVVNLTFESDSSSPSTVTIGNSAFYNCASLRTIDFGDRVGSIGNSAFYGCSMVAQTISLSAKTTSVGDSAFYGCTKITGLDIPSGSLLSTVGEKAFYNCSAMIGAVEFPATISSIGDSAFDVDSRDLKLKITSLTFAPSSVPSLTIGKKAFRFCDSIGGSITFPASLTLIDEHAFSNCSSIQEIHFTNGASALEICDSAFNTCTSINGTIFFPEKLSSIGVSAFYGCTSIDALEFAIDGDLTTIGNNAFYNCTSITDLLVLPNGLTSIGDGAFRNTAFTGALALPASLVTLGSNAFNGCSGLTSVTFGNNITTIGNYAFYNCKNITGSLVIPNSVTTIGSNSFTGNGSSNAPKFMGVTFGTGLTAINANAFQYTLVSGKVTNGDLVFPNSLTAINDSVFNGCTGITSVTFGTGLTTLGNSVFNGCTGITGTLILPDGLTSIGNSAFNGCTGITGVGAEGVDLSNTHVTTIGSQVFYGCSGLSGVLSLPSSLVSIGASAFYNGTGLTSIEFNGNTVLTTIDTSAFNGCSNLTGVIEFPESLEALGNNAFRDCTRITGIDFSANDSLMTIGQYAFYRCSALSGTVTIPSTVTTISHYAFEGTSVTSFELGRDLEIVGTKALLSYSLRTVTVDPNNTHYAVVDNVLYDYDIITLVHCPAQRASTSVTVPNTVTTIEQYALSKTSTLESITLPSSSFTIMNYAFSESSLTGTLTIPETAYSIGRYAFSGSTGITAVVINSTRADLLSAYAFTGCTGLTSLTVPVTVKLVVPTTGSNCDLIFDIGSTIRNYTFTGAESGLPDTFYRTYYAKMPWYYSTTSTVRISVAFDSVQTIDPYMFYSNTTTNRYIYSLDMGDDLTSVGAYAFYNCIDLQTVIVSESLSIVNDHAFSGCTKIATLTIPVDIDAKLFGVSTTALSTLNLVSGKTGVGRNYIETDKTALVWNGSSNYTVNIASGVYSIGEYTYLCASGSLTIPGTVESIGKYAFDGSTMTALTIEDGVTAIGDHSFGNCLSLSTVTLPNTLATVTGSPFASCVNLNRVNLPITVEYKGTMFDGCTSLREFVFTRGTTYRGVDYTTVTAAQTPWYALCGNNNFSVTFDSEIIYIGAYMFYGCVAAHPTLGDRGLQGAVVIPSKVTEVGQYAFKGCTNVTSISVTGSNVRLNDGVFEGCTGASSLTFPMTSNSVVNTEAPVFGGCTGFTSFTFIGSGAGFDYTADNYRLTPWYQSQRNITSLTVGDGITSIGDMTFRGCTKLTSAVTLGSAVTNIGQSAFEGCTGITEVSLSSGTLVFEASAFKGCSSITTLTIDIMVNAVGNDGNNPAFEGCTGMTALSLLGSGTGVGYDYTQATSASTPWAMSIPGYGVTIASGVTKIGSYMFYGCDTLNGAVSASGLRNMSPYAFYGCTRMTSFSAPLLASVPEYAFYGCSALSSATLTGCTSVGAHSFQDSGITYVNSDTEVSLPNVEYVGDYAFAGSAVSKITLGKDTRSFTYFGDYVFHECPNLTEVNINGILSRLPYNTFRSSNTSQSFNFRLRVLRADKVSVFAANLQNCTNLETISILSVTSFEADTDASDGKFRGCTSLREVALSENRVILPRNAFSGCVALTTIDASHLSLEKGYEFYGCTALESVILTSMTIPESAFEGCTSLTGINASMATSVGDHAFKNTGITTLGSGTVLIPNLTTIGAGAFEGCTSLTTASSNATTASASAFSGCTVLSTVSFPEMTSVPESMFYGCINLSDVGMDKALYISAKAFYGCSNLVTLSMSKVERIGTTEYSANNLEDYTTYSVFYGSTRLTGVTMPQATSVGAFAFYGCASFKSFNGSGVFDLSGVTSIGFAAFAYTAPTSVTVGNGSTASIGDYAFYVCSTMTSFAVNGGLSSIGGSSLYGCQVLASVTIPISSDWTSNYRLPNLTSLSFTVGTSSVGFDYTESNYNSSLWSASSGYAVSFASGITRIGDWMCLSASGSVTIPSTVAEIGTRAFYGSPMTTLTIASTSPLSIGNAAFGNCSSLTSAVLPDSLASFSGTPFTGCTSLSSVSLPISFGYTGDLFTGCTSLSSFAFTRGTGTGYAYTAENHEHTPWYTATSNITVTFGENIASIGAYTFMGCTNLNGSIVLPSTLTAVGAHAFDGDSNITLLSFAANNVTLGISSFKGCSRIASLTIPIGANTVVDAVNPAFEGCTGLTTLTLSGSGEGCNYVDSSSSNSYYALTPWYLSRSNSSLAVTIADGITTIGTYMFKDCTALSGRITSNGATSVGSHVFYGCTNVTKFEAPLLKNMGAYAFYGCGSITEVSAINLASVPDYAFYGCTNLVTLDTINATSIGISAFENSGIKNICEEGTGAILTKVTSVGDRAFARSGVETITLGKAGSNLEMGDYVLLECPYLTTVTIDGRLGELKFNTFRTATTDGFSSPLTTLTANSTGTFSAMLTGFRSLTNVHIRAATEFNTTVTEGMFKDCVSLTTVDLYNASDSLSIPLPKSAFEGCISLTTINMEHMNLNKGREFYGCTALNNITITQATSIAQYSFYGCSDLTDISAPKATSMGSYAFAESGIVTVTPAMFAKLLTVGDYVFAGCLSLSSVDIPTVTTMGEYVFSGCTSLTTISLNALNEIGYGVFYGCSALVTVSFTSARSVKELAFYGCRALTRVSFPSLTSLGDTSATVYTLDDYQTKSVFYNCVTLTRIEMPIVTEIGAFAFYGCSNANAFNVAEDEDGLYLPNVVSIRFAAFAGTGFVDVTVGKAGGFRSISDYAFYGCSSMRTFSAPSLTELPTHLFNNTDISAASAVPELITISVPSVLKFLANMHGCTRLTTADVSSATEFCDDAFYGCSMLNSVTLSNTLTVTLSTRMFYGCERLSTINLGNAILDGGYMTDSAGETFRGCRSLTSVNMPLATKITTSAFYGCTGIQSVSVPAATVIGAGAFRGCTSLREVAMPEATRIYENGFYGCTSLAAVNPDEDVPFLNITEIRNNAFYDCALTSLILGPNLVTLGDGAFAYNSITTVVIPNSTNSNLTLSEGLFQGCPLTEVHISSSVKYIYAHAFDVSGTAVREISFWFNVSITTNLMRPSAITGNNTQTVVLHTDNDSQPLIDTVVSMGHISGFATVTKVKEFSATVTIQTEENATPTYTNLRAIYGGLIVLPYVNYGNSVLGVVEYAVIDSNDRHLATYASDADFSSSPDIIAKTGYALPVFPVKDNDAVTLTSRADGSGFVKEITVYTESYETPVNIQQQTVHYGGVMTIPRFTDTSIQIKGLNLIRADGVSYPMDTTLETIRVGYFYSTIEMMSEDVKVTVTFISKGDVQSVQVQIQSAFAVPADLKYMESPDAGYSFGGWWSSEGGTGNKAGPDTKFSQGQRWYAYFPAIEYTINVESDIPHYSAEFKAYGPYVYHVVGNSLYYTDTMNTYNVLLFDANTITGWSVNVYGDRNNYGAPITGENYDAYAENPGDSVVDLYLVMNNYSITLQFTNGGVSLPDVFLIEGWAVGGTKTEYRSGDVVSDIPYSSIENGLEMPIPLNNTYAFSRMLAGSTQITYRNGGYFLNVTHFGDSLSVVVTYEMEIGLYTIRFTLNDDANTVYTNSSSIAVGDTFLMPSVQRNYFKTGYIFDHIEITGIDHEYAERDLVELTDEMVSHSTFCVVDVYVVWITIPYRVEFNLSPYEGTVPAIEDIRVGQTVILPTVTGYVGYSVTGWHWYKGTEVSESFTENPVLTKEAVDNYGSADRVMHLQIEWTKKIYTLSVDPESGYVFAQKTVTYGDGFYLWTNTYTRSFMEFGGWQVAETVYPNGAQVVLDDNMAAMGDAHGDSIVFGMYWIKSEYQVQYNLDGGKGKIPTDDNVYIVDESPFALAVIDEEKTFRDGYSFQGWKYSRDSYLIYTNTSGLFEEVLAQNSTDNIVTFYAVWEQKTYRITYDLQQGVAGEYAPQKVFYGDEITISNPTRNGWEFDGWTATGLTSGALYKSSSGYRGWDGERKVTTTQFMDLCNIDDGEVVMKANWITATYMISYNLNGGEGTPVGEQKNIEIGDEIILPTLLDASRKGYTYIGWGVDTKNALAEHTIFTEDMAPARGNTLILYAIWSPVEYTVMYRYSSDYEYTSFVTSFENSVLIPMQDRSGYVFKGWSLTNVDRSTAYYSADGVDWYKLGTAASAEGPYFKNLSTTSGATVTLEGIWQEIGYRIAYNPNGGTGKAPVDGQTYVIGDKVQMMDYNVLAGTNGSKSVVGWSLEQNGAATVVTEFTSSLATYADVTNTVNFYAVWVEGMCTVSVYLDGCTVSSVPAGWTLTINGTYDKLVEYGTNTKDVMADWDNITISKDGYNFIGWNYSSAIVTTTVTVDADFEKVNQSIMLVFGGAVAAIVAGTIALVFIRK